MPALLFLQLCQGITSWLGQEAEKKKKNLTPVVKKQKRKEEDNKSQPHLLHAPPLSDSSTLASKSLPHSPSGTSYSISSLVRINLHMGFHSPCGELFQLLNIHLLQHNLEYLNSTTEFILAGDRVTSGMTHSFLTLSIFSYPYQWCFKLHLGICKWHKVNKAMINTRSGLSSIVDIILHNGPCFDIAQQQQI